MYIEATSISLTNKWHHVIPILSLLSDAAQIKCIFACLTGGDAGWSPIVWNFRLLRSVLFSLSKEWTGASVYSSRWFNRRVTRMTAFRVRGKHRFKQRVTVSGKNAGSTIGRIIMLSRVAQIVFNRKRERILLLIVFFRMNHDGVPRWRSAKTNSAEWSLYS